MSELLVVLGKETEGDGESGNGKAKEEPTEPYEQRDEPSQNGDRSSSTLFPEHGYTEVVEEIIAGAYTLGDEVTRLVAKGDPKQNGDETGRDLGDDDEEVVPDPDKESKNVILQPLPTGEGDGEEEGGGDDDNGDREVIIVEPKPNRPTAPEPGKHRKPTNDQGVNLFT